MRRILKSRQSQSLQRQFLRIVVLATLPLFLFLTASNLAIYYTSRKTTERQLEDSARWLQNMIEVQLENSIRAYLNSKVEVGVEIVRDALERQGVLSVEDVAPDLLELSVGDTGYFYGLDGNGTILFHPDPNLVGVNLANESPVNVQIAEQSGYYEYLWQNTFERGLQPKALYMDYIPELDWIITATSYRSEFTSIVDVESIRSIVLESRVGDTGYSYVFDSQGNQIAHPYIDEISDTEGLGGDEGYLRIIERLYEQKEGSAVYSWRDNPRGLYRRKIIFFKYLPDFDWVVGTSIYRSEINRPLLLFIIGDTFMALAIGLLLGVVIGRMNRSIQVQLENISQALDAGRHGIVTAQFDDTAPEELVTIAENINYFIESLNQRTQELQELNDSLEGIVERKTTELSEASRQLIESEKLALTSQLVAGVAHEINTPIGIATTAVSYIEDIVKQIAKDGTADTDEEQTNQESLTSTLEAAHIAMVNLKRAAKLVTSFKSVSIDQLSLAKRRFRLTEVVADVLESMRPALKKKSIQIDVDVPENEMDSYPGVFVHILVNFISNSLVHGFKDSLEGRISIKAFVQDDQMTMEYRDDGRGIEPGMEEKVFDPFVTTGRTGGSTGLGLNIVRNLVVDKLHGLVRADTASNGAVFIVTFPFEEA